MTENTQPGSWFFAESLFCPLDFNGDGSRYQLIWTPVISHHNGGAMRRRIVRHCQCTALEPLAPSWFTRWASYRGSGDSRDEREWQI
jgi:hypothetical protein